MRKTLLLLTVWTALVSASAHFGYFDYVER